MLWRLTGGTSSPSGIFGERNRPRIPAVRACSLGVAFSELLGHLQPHPADRRVPDSSTRQAIWGCVVTGELRINMAELKVRQ